MLMSLAPPGRYILLTYSTTNEQTTTTAPASMLTATTTITVNDSHHHPQPQHPQHAAWQVSICCADHITNTCPQPHWRLWPSPPVLLQRHTTTSSFSDGNSHAHHHPQPPEIMMMTASLWSQWPSLVQVWMMMPPPTFSLSMSTKYSTYITKASCISMRD